MPENHRNEIEQMINNAIAQHNRQGMVFGLIASAVLLTTGWMMHG